MAFPDLTIAPQSELDAVNRMLWSIGARPVNSLSGTLPLDAAGARQVLHDTSRAVQADGWWFNRECGWELAKDVNNRFPIPATALQIDPTERWHDFVERVFSGTRYLYDRQEHTFVMPDVASPLKVDITWFFPFEELPEVVRQYISVRAARTFQAGRVQSDLIYQFQASEEGVALTTMQRVNRRASDTNIHRGSSRVNRIRRRHGGMPAFY